MADIVEIGSNKYSQVTGVTGLHDFLVQLNGWKTRKQIETDQQNLRRGGADVMTFAEGLKELELRGKIVVENNADPSANSDKMVE